jgi:hypothetical protein
MSWISWKCAAGLRSHADPSTEVITEVKPEVRKKLRCSESLRSHADPSTEVITEVKPEVRKMLRCSENFRLQTPRPEY